MLLKDQTRCFEDEQDAKSVLLEIIVTGRVWILFLSFLRLAASGFRSVKLDSYWGMAWRVDKFEICSNVPRSISMKFPLNICSTLLYLHWNGYCGKKLSGHLHIHLEAKINAPKSQVF